MKLLLWMVLLALPLAAQPVIELRETPMGTTVAPTGSIALGSFSQRDVIKTIYIVNTGTTALNVSSVTTDNENGCSVNAVTGFPTVVAPGANTTATLIITVTVMGSFDLDIEVLSDDPVTPNYNIGAIGTGVSAPDLRVLFDSGVVNNGATQNIGTNWSAGNPNQFTLVLYNWGIVGSPDLTWGPGAVLTVLSQTGCALGMASDPTMPLATGSWIPLYNTLNIPAAGPFSFTIQIVTNDPDESPWTGIFNGVAVNDPIIRVSGSNGGQILHDGYVALGALPAGVSTTYSGSVRNDGVGTMMLTGTPVIEFTNQVNCTVTLIVTPMDTYNTSVSDLWAISIVPTVAGPFSFDLVIANNTPTTPLYVAHFVDVLPPPPPPPPSGNGDGGSGDDEGCSTGQGNAPWLALLAALTCFALTARLRRA